MTYLRKFKIFLAVAILGLAVSSCLDDQPLYDKDSTHNVIEFYTVDSYASTEGAELARYSVAFQATPEETLNVTLSYSGPNTAPEDIQVTIATDTATVSAYNQSLIDAERQKAIDAGKDPNKIDTASLGLYDKLPESLYSIPSATVTIPKGERKATYSVKLKVDQFDFHANYAIAFTIKSTSTGVISGNYGTVLYAVSPKNSLDGVYTLPKLDIDSMFYDRNLSGATADYPRTIQLITKSLNTVAYFDPALNSGTYGYSFVNADQGTYYGSWAPLFFFEGDKITKVENYYGQNSGASKRSGRINPRGPNKISKDDKGNTVIEVWYYMVQGSNAATDPVRSEFREKFVYTAPRP